MSFLTHKNRFWVDMVIKIELISFCIDHEFSKLGETFMNHNQFGWSWPIRNIRDENRSILFQIAFIKFLLNPNTSAFRLTNSSFWINDEGHVTISCWSMNKRKRAFLNHGSAHQTIALKLNYKKSSFSF